MRNDHAASFGQELADKTARLVPADEPIGLVDCVRIALANNLDIKSAEIETRIAALDKQIAFANFLPQIDLELSYVKTDKPRMTRAGPDYIQVCDQSITQTTISAQQPIFVPQAWFLYSLRQKGQDISKLVRTRTQQFVALRVAVLYFACLSQEEMQRYLQNAVTESQALRNEILAMEREGLVTSVQRHEIETLVLMRQNALSQNARALRQTEADLLSAMGLSPFAEIQLKKQTPLPPQTQELADQVLKAMLARPELHVADRVIEIRKDETRIAIAEFLPKIVGVGGFTHSNDSYLKHANMWTGGVVAVMSVFDGFRTIGEYKAARQREKTAFVEREQRCMMVMLEVLRAHLNLTRTEDDLRLARQNLLAAKASLDEITARWREGLIQTSDRLAAITRHDKARAGVAMATYQQQTAIAAVMGAMGQMRY